MFTSGSDLKSFTLAGHAILTLVSAKTSERYTFKVARAPDKGDGKPRPWFVGLLSGPDNTSNYTYMGMIDAVTGEFRLTGKSRYAATSIPVRAFAYFWRAANAEHIAADLEVHHSGHCGRCGRLLTVPGSIQSGIGPECAAKMSQGL
jgi:hypothetical protein